MLGDEDVPQYPISGGIGSTRSQVRSKSTDMRSPAIISVYAGILYFLQDDLNHSIVVHVPKQE